MTTLQGRSAPRPERIPASGVRRPAALRVGPAAAALGAAALVVTWLGSWNPSYWGDEAATVMSAQRSLTALFAELRHIDAVHGLYYLFMHFWIGAFGPSELSTRFPSAIAVGLLVAGTVVLGARLAGVRFGIVAGLICLALPRTTYLATEARSYAIGTAVAVWVTVWFVGLLRRREQRLWPWLIYGVLVGLASYLFLYLLLMLLVHGAVLATSMAGRRGLGRWLIAAVAAAIVAAPIAVMGYIERSQIAFLAIRKYGNPYDVFVQQWFGAPARVGTLSGALWAVPIAAWVLILLGVGLVIVRTARRSPDAVLDDPGSDREVLRLGLAWLVIPTALLLAVNAWVSPTYNVRYLSFSTPAAALLIALGVVGLARLLARAVPRLPRQPLTGAAIGLILVLFAAIAAPGYLLQRGPYAKDAGSDWRQTADYLQSVAQPGDAVVFDGTAKTSRRPLLAYRLYPQQFAALSVPQLVTPYYARAALWDRMAPLADVRPELLSAPSVWAVELPSAGAIPAEVADLTAHGYHVVSAHIVHRIEVYQLQKEDG